MYQQVLEGLEAVEVKFIETKNIIDSRIDSETYKRIFLETEAILKSRTTKTIDQLSISVQNFGAYSLCNYINFMPDGVRFLMTQNVRDNYIDFENVNFITQKVHEILYKSHCKLNQVLLTMAGAYLGRAAVFNKNFECSSNQAIAKITLSDGINPYFLSTFLNGKYGQNQIQRFKTTTGQPNINMSLIKELQIVLAEDSFQLIISEVVKKALDLFEEQEISYTKSTEKIKEKINLTNWSIPDQNISIKTFQNSVIYRNRIDAEYYQPKYDELLSIISNYDTDILDHLVKIKKSIEPGSAAYLSEGVPFLRVADLSKYGLSQPEIFLDPAIYNVEDLMPRKDTILLSKDGSVGIAYKVEEDTEAITSGAILHLMVKDDRVLPDYLCLVLNSTVVQLQAERDAGGSIIQHWKPDEIKQVVIPILPKPVQQELVTMIQDSFQLQKQSKHLLEAAKHAVEIAIEQGEETALNWLRENKIID